MNKKEFVDQMGCLLREGCQNEYIVSCYFEEEPQIVHVLFTNGDEQEICVAHDSNLAILHDVSGALLR